MAATSRGHVVALCGGIGGAKLALGLADILPPERLTVVVNVGDDFDHLGFRICPDLDTVTYTLAGLADPVRGWGRADETWAFMAETGRLGGETWFSLGDRDLALHARRRALLSQGLRLTEVTALLAASLGVAHRILPVSDERVATIVETADGPLAFQHWFVRDRCGPAVRRLAYEGANAARPSPEIEATLGRDDLAGIILCPSNPFLSIDPMLAIPGVRERIRGTGRPVVAVSPIVGGTAVKGPLATMLRDLGHEVSHRAIAKHYEGFVDTLVVDENKPEINGMEMIFAPTLMRSREEKVMLARRVVDLITRERVA